jgi:hypothetical protein
MILDTRTNEWLFKMEDPQNTREFSRYFQPALKLLKEIQATGKHDFELEKQVAKLNWLIAGNSAAVGEEKTVSPIDPLQLTCYAELNRVRGSQTMLEAARLRAPKTWSNSSRRSLGNGTEEITTVTYTRPATAEECAAADRLDFVAKSEDAVRCAALEDLAFKLPPTDPLPYYLFGRVEATYYDLQLADRVIEHGLMIDPGSAELHAARVIAWQSSKKVNESEVGCAERFSAPYTLDDLQGGGKLSLLDPMAGYFYTLQRLRISVDNVGSHAVMSDVLGRVSGTKLNKLEFMPDADEQRQRELAICAVMMGRLLEHPENFARDLPKGMPTNRPTLMKVYASFYSMRADLLASLGRDAEAQWCRGRASQIGG